MRAAFLRLFSEGFRVFFLAAGGFAIVAMLVWELYLGLHYAGGMLDGLPFAQAPHLWHAHEMIFGYGTAALGGFLLTAVPSWTGTKAAPWRFIALAAGLWAAGRVAIWLSGGLPAGLVAALDLAFVLLMIAKIATQLVRRPKPQNVAFVAFLSLLWISNLLVHLDWMGVSDGGAERGLRAGLLALCLMIAVLGGRVTPAFTRNAMKRAGLPEARWPVSRRWLDLPATVALFGLVLALLADLPVALAGALAIVAGAAGLARMARWGGVWCLGQPILWALHLSMAALGAGLLLWGAAQFGHGSEVAALHVLGIATVGGMTLAVMSRAVLGHTGRPLVAPQGVAFGYGLIFAAAVLRWAGSTFLAEWYFPLTLASGGLWCLAFACYLVALAPAMTGRRVARA